MANSKKRGRPLGRHQEEGEKKIQVSYRLFSADRIFIRELTQELKRTHPYGGRSDCAAIHELIVFYQAHHSRPQGAVVIDGNRRLAVTASPPPA